MNTSQVWTPHLKTFKNNQQTPATTLEDILNVFCTKNVKPESSASAKHVFSRLSFDAENQKLPDFLEELQERAEKAFGDNAHQMIENLLYAKMPPHLKKSIKQAKWSILPNRQTSRTRDGTQRVGIRWTSGAGAKKKEQNAEKANKEQNEKSKTQTSKTNHQQQSMPLLQKGRSHDDRRAQISQTEQTEERSRC